MDDLINACGDKGIDQIPRLRQFCGGLSLTFEFAEAKKSQKKMSCKQLIFYFLKAKVC